jgi:hypothetical protein
MKKRSSLFTPRFSPLPFAEPACFKAIGYIRFMQGAPRGLEIFTFFIKKIKEENCKHIGFVL